MDPSRTAMDVYECSPADPSAPFVSFSPPGIVRRKASHWRGIRAETVLATRCEPFEYGFNGPCHLLIASERAQRRGARIRRRHSRFFASRRSFDP